MFAVCTLIFVLIVNTAYGWESLQTSAQVLNAAFSFSIVPFSAGQEQILTIIVGLLTVLSQMDKSLFYELYMCLNR